MRNKNQLHYNKKERKKVLFDEVTSIQLCLSKDRKEPRPVPRPRTPMKPWRGVKRTTVFEERIKEYNGREKCSGSQLARRMCLLVLLLISYCITFNFSKYIIIIIQLSDNWCPQREKRDLEYAWGDSLHSGDFYKFQNQEIKLIDQKVLYLKGDSF